MASNDQRGPDHYRRGLIQPWDFIRDQGLNYHLGNAIKYICRAGYKDSAIDDLNKAIHYLENERDHLCACSARIQKEVRIEESTDDYLSGLAAEFDR